jgi:hypothetical protein
MSLARMSTIGLCALTFTLSGIAHAAVTAVQLGGKLVVIGESLDDVIHVEGSDALGEITVLEGVSPTLVGSFIGVQDIEIKTGDGNDAVNVSGVEIGGSLKAKLGAGVDFLRIDDLLVDGVTERATFIGAKVAAALGDQAGDSFECRTQTVDGGIRIGGGVDIRGATSVTLDGIGSSGRFGSERHLHRWLARRPLEARNDGDRRRRQRRWHRVGPPRQRPGLHRDRRRALQPATSTCAWAGGDDVLRFEDSVEFNANLSINGGSGLDKIEGSPVQIAGNAVAKSIEG